MYIYIYIYMYIYLYIYIYIIPDLRLKIGRVPPAPDPACGRRRRCTGAAC